MLSCGTMEASLDFVLSASRDVPAVVSFFDRSLSTVKAIGASLCNIKKFYAANYPYCSEHEYNVFINPIITGKDKFYHGLAISKGINSTILISEDGKEAESLYHLLMNNYSYPLMYEWKEEILKWFMTNHILRCNAYTGGLQYGKNHISSDMKYGNTKISMDQLKVYQILVSDEVIENCVKELFQKKLIWISKEVQNKLEFTDMDSYFSKYGTSLVENLEKSIQPLVPLNGTVESHVLKHMRLFPQQGALVNGVDELLRKSSYAILNEGMGTGKTCQGASIVEGYFVNKFLRSNPDKTLRDAYLEEGAVCYRSIIMCPGHLVQKWADHVKDEIPYARVNIIHELSQLIDIWKKGRERTCREWYVISKDFAKLSYQNKPTPKIRRFGHIMKKVCTVCGEENFTVDKKCKCGGILKLVHSGYKGEGMVCPHCNNILVPYKTVKLQQNLSDEERTTPLDYVDFTNQSITNSNCFYCGNELWQPHVANLGTSEKKNTWYRSTHYANKAHKAKKTVWVHKKYADLYYNSIGESPLNNIDSDVYQGTRKIAPACFIKKHMKGFFDFAIFDECHLLKSGTSAQGNAMHALLKASKKSLSLTGTIAGGQADHLFYLLYRLDPARMLSKGYQWDDVIKFVEKYGKLEKTYEAEEKDNGNFNVCSKGRQKGTPKVKPGISPLIFMDYLLDKTVFLDITDMSKYLPPLKEIVELVDIPYMIEDQEGNMVENPEADVKSHYMDVIDALKQMSKQKGGGLGVLSKMLKFSLSYLDKPYGINPIKSSITGEIMVNPINYGQYSSLDSLLAKERRLIEIVNQEQREGRNMVIYAEFTGSPETCVTYRLKALLEKHCGLRGKVEVIESNYPAASKREEWMHKKAQEGIKVFITNPKNVETGLDFCFKKDGVIYNYPTLIFYQMGYSLFTIWQASRRHYRLNQKEECRTYYMAVKYTVQATVIELIAEKMAATSAIQGKFSTEGLSAMANGVDEKIKLAQALSSHDNTSRNDLQGMFDVINQDEFDDSQYRDFKPMLTLKELVGDAVWSMEQTTEEMNVDIFDLLESFDTFYNDFSQRNLENSFDTGIANIKTEDVIINLPKSSKKKAAATSQMSIFDL